MMSRILLAILLSANSAFGAAPFWYCPTTNDLIAIEIKAINARNIAVLSGFATTNDNNGGVFIYLTNSTTAVDWTDVFKPANQNGRWHRMGILNAGGVPTTRTITAGSGLTGGGDLSADRTLDVGAGTGITVNANDVAINQAFTPTWTGTHTFNNSTYSALFSGGPVGIGASTPSIGLDVEKALGFTFGKFGSLAPIYLVANGATVGFNAYYNSGWKYGKGSSGSYAGNMGIDHNDGTLYYQATSSSGNEDAAATMTTRLSITRAGLVTVTGKIAGLTQGTASGEAIHAARTVTSGNGLTGGGDLTSDRTLAVGAGNGITSNSDDVESKNFTLFSQTSAATVANTTTQTSVLSGAGTLTVPANELAAGSVIRIRAGGKVKTKAAPVGTGNMWFSVGGTSSATGDVGLPAGTAPGFIDWKYELVFSVRTAGASGTFAWQQEFNFHDSGAVKGAATFNDSGNIDTTGTIAVDLQWAWGTASADNSLTCEWATITIDRP